MELLSALKLIGADGVE